MKTLFVTDLDGTLLGEDSRVSPESARIISDLTRRGALITVATARTPATVEPLLAATDIRVPAIVMTGAALWDLHSHRFINTAVLSQHNIQKVIGVMTTHGINPFIYTPKGEGELVVYHNGGMTRHEDTFYQVRRSLPLKRFVLDEADGYARDYGTAILLLGIGDTEQISAVADLLKADPSLSVSAYADIFNPRLSYIEVFRAEVSKARAVQYLSHRVGATRVVVYGDNLNDLPMMAVADESVAVDNALPEVLACADRAIGPNTSSSVAHDMRKLFDN